MLASPNEKTRVEYWKYLRLEYDVTADSSREHVDRNRSIVDDMRDYIVSVFTSVAQKYLYFNFHKSIRCNFADSRFNEP